MAKYKPYQRRFTESTMRLSYEIEAWTGDESNSTMLPAGTTIEVIGIFKDGYGDLVTSFRANGKIYNAYADTIG